MKQITVEVIYKADYCLPCFYMDEAMQELLPKYGERVIYKRVCFWTAMRMRIVLRNFPVSFTAWKRWKIWNRWRRYRPCSLTVN